MFKLFQCITNHIYIHTLHLILTATYWYKEQTTISSVDVTETVCSWKGVFLRIIYINFSFCDQFIVTSIYDADIEITFLHCDPISNENNAQLFIYYKLQSNKFAWCIRDFIALLRCCNLITNIDYGEVFCSIPKCICFLIWYIFFSFWCNIEYEIWL